MKHPSWLRRHPRGAVAATGLLALVLSALPLAALHIADVPLLNHSYGRFWQDGSTIQVNSQDFYLLKALREQQRLHEEGLYWQSEEFFMDRAEGEALLLDYLDDLVQADVLKEEWVDPDVLFPASPYVDGTESELLFSYSGNGAGFVVLQVQERSVQEQVIQHIWNRVLVDSKTGKIAHFGLSMPQYEIDLDKLMKQYVAYLGFSGLDDWKNVPNPMYENALYSAKAQAMVAASMYTDDARGIQVVYCTLSVFENGDVGWLEQEMDWYS